MSKQNAILARNTELAPQSVGPYSHTVAFSHYNNISAQLPIDPQSGVIVANSMRDQAEQCFKNIKSVLNSIGHIMSDVVRITIFVRDFKEIDTINDVYKAYFPGYVPARTIVGVAALPLNALIQIEALASNGEGTIPNAPQAGDLIKLTNNTTSAPVDPLSTQIVAFSHYSNVSAQLPIDPKSGRLVVGGIKEQTRQCLNNIKAILESIDVPLDDIVKINIFLTDLSDVDAADEVYRTFFPDSAIARTAAYFPARTVVAVTALPMDALVQIEAVVSHGDGTPPQAIEDRHGLIIKAHNISNMQQGLPYTQTVAFSHYNHISAQLPVNLFTGKLIKGSVRKQTEQCLNNISDILKSINHSLDDVVKINIFLKNIEDVKAVDEVYRTFFPTGTPARRIVGVTALLKDALVQIDAVVSNAEGTSPKG